MSSKDNFEALLVVLSSLSGPSPHVDSEIAYAFRFRPDSDVDPLWSFRSHEARHGYNAAWIAHAPWRNSWNIPAFTASIDAVRALIKQEMPGWIYRVAECSVSDDAWLIPDFNDPVHGAGFLSRFGEKYQRDPLKEFGTDIDRRPSGHPAIAMCMALVTAKIAVMKLEN